MELGGMGEAAKAVHKYRLRYWGGKGHGGVGHKLLIYYARLGDEKAFFELFDGFEEDLRTAVARMLAAQMYMAAGRAEDAAAVIRPIVDEAEAAIEAQPEYADPYFRLAQTIAVAGTDPDRAKQTAFAALEHHPGAVLRLEVYALLAQLYLKQGKLEQARLLADAAASLYSTEHPRYIGLQRRVNAAGETAPDER
jgi:tetratricopeptide (TPR) repeat protein